MDIEKLKATIPSGQRLHQLNPRDRKKSVEDAIEVVLSAIEREGRNPDVWETDALLHAMGAVLRGQHWLAATNVDLALTPSDNRSPEAKIEAESSWSAQKMRRTLDAVRAAPYE